MEESKRFVVQEHQRASEPTHWDLMLEHDGMLETYRVACPPEKWGKELVEAVKIFDHPFKFLSYEGRVNKGKGQVQIADCGTYRLIKKYKNQHQISFAGRILKGEYLLRLIKEDKWELNCI